MVTRNQILDAIQRGIVIAHNRCKSASQAILYDTHECFISVNIFHSIFSLTQADTLTLEDRVTKIEQCFSSTPRGRRIAELPKGGHFDLIIWYPNSGRIRGIIEVKKKPINYLRDIKRLCKTLAGNQHFCALISCVYECYNEKEPQSKKEALNKLNSKVQKILDSVQQCIKEQSDDLNLTLMPFEPKPVHIKAQRKYYMWRPVCFVIENE